MASLSTIFHDAESRSFRLFSGLPAEPDGPFELSPAASCVAAIQQKTISQQVRSGGRLLDHLQQLLTSHDGRRHYLPAK
jgi:hypothetical protein